MWGVLYDVGDAGRMSVRDKTIDAAIMLERSWWADVPGSRTSSRRRPGTRIRRSFLMDKNTGTIRRS